MKKVSEAPTAVAGGPSGLGAVVEVASVCSSDDEFVDSADDLIGTVDTQAGHLGFYPSQYAVCTPIINCGPPAGHPKYVVLGTRVAPTRTRTHSFTTQVTLHTKRFAYAVYVPCRLLAVPV